MTLSGRLRPIRCGKPDNSQVVRKLSGRLRPIRRGKPDNSGGLTQLSARPAAAAAKRADDVRDALSIPSQIPVVICDARKRDSVIEVLLAMVGHALAALPE